MSTAGSREINVTPLIDVLLVLLIIFLVMMPIMLRTETVQLPPHNKDVDPDGIMVIIKLDRDLSVAFDDGPSFPNRELATRLRPKLANARGVFVDFDHGVLWDHVISTVDTVRGVAGDVSHPDFAVAVRIRDD